MYLSELDIANRGLQHCGETRILTADEDSKANSAVSFVYDKLRLAELRRNVWRFSIRRAILRAIDGDTLILNPDEWNANISYPPGAIVRDENGILWASVIAENINNDPATTTAWDRYFGPMTVHKYDEDTSYYAGELVWAESGNPGGYVIFRSLTNGNESDPETSDAWDATVTYRAGQTVSHGGDQWRSLIEVNLNVTPAVGPLDWDEGATYSSGQSVTGSDGYIYTSAVNGNVGFQPVGDGGSHWTNTTVPHAWKRVPVIFASATSWQPLFAAMTNLVIPYPVQIGSPAGYSRAVFRLPAGFVRIASQNPKQGATAYLGAPSGNVYDMKDIESDYLISPYTSGVIMFRFAADVSEVRSMDPMFCEGLAARIGFEVCEELTQSSSKKGGIAGAYQKFMTEARTVNAIEVGSEEPAEDDFLTCRI